MVKIKVFFTDGSTYDKGSSCPKLRQYCIENGMEHLENEDWDNYKKERMEQLGSSANQFMVEQYGEKMVSLESIMTERPKGTESDLRDLLTKHTNKLFDDLREVSVEMHLAAAKRTIDLLAFIENKAKGFYAGMPISTAMEVINDAGDRKVEIDNMQNRELVKKQMSKVDDMLSKIYDEMTIRYLGIVTKKLKDM